MSQISDKNKRIAKNTVMLYFRMFIMMAIGLFTSRITLQALGVNNYGINNVVGGIVAMFSLVTGALVNSVSRFLTFELGKKDKNELNKVFGTSINVMILLSLIVLILGETIGLWFLYNKLNILPDRLGAANVVLQCSIISCILGLLYLPYNALIIAYEKMSIWAYFSIIEAVLKLFAVYVLYISSGDKLIIYALLGLICTVIMQILYRFYCHRTFNVVRYHVVLDRQLLRQIFGFAGWNFLGQGAYIINNEGVNIVLNLFFGVVVNAARGIAMSVNGYVTQFANNFIIALNPQIIKSYAAKNYQETHKLIFKGAKFTYFLMFLLVLPLCLETKMLLYLWLGEVPEYAVAFVRWTFCITIINSLSNTLITGLHASGNLKHYMLIVGIVESLNFPLTYLAFKFGATPIMAYYIFAGVYLVLMFLRLYLIKREIFLKAKDYIRAVYMHIVPVTICACIAPTILYNCMDTSFLRLISVIIVSLLSSIIFIYIFGLEKNERKLINNYVSSKLLRKLS